MCSILYRIRFKCFRNFDNNFLKHYGAYKYYGRHENVYTIAAIAYVLHGLNASSAAGLM